MSFNISQFNDTGGVSTFVSLVGMDINSTDATNVFDIGATVVLVNVTHIRITITSTSSVSTYMNSLDV